MSFPIAYLMAKAAPLPHVAAILCTLGIISLFSLSVVGQTISWKIAGAMFAVVVGLGIIRGVIALSVA